MKKEISWKKELSLAKAYAESGPNDFPKSYMERCLRKAIEKAQKENVDISQEVERIKKIWKNHKDNN